VNRSFMQVGAVLGLISIVFFTAWPIWKWIKFPPASAALYARVQAQVQKEPKLKLAWDVALQDEVLTHQEAKAIMESVGEKVEPEK
jgi:hypothetical protein